MLIDRGGVEERVAHVAARPRPPRDDDFLFGKALVSALVAWGRACRGETLSATFLVTWGTTYLCRLLIRTVPSPAHEAPEQGARVLLDVLERELRPRRPDLPWAAFDAVRARTSRAG